MSEKRPLPWMRVVLGVLVAAFVGIGAELFWLSSIREGREVQAEEPEILYVVPPSIVPGETTGLLVRGGGTEFSSETTAWFDVAGVTVVERECVSPERLLVKVLADANLTAGSVSLCPPSRNVRRGMVRKP
ncbi:MAG: hypothetical protein JXP34_26060 [Planctomycetes bacterium]|nr:hypothetical protein [Planctomycetota bacterium]